MHDIAAPEPPPAGIAPFRDQMPLQTGNCAPGLRLFQRVHLQDTRIPRLWTLNLDLSDPGVSAAVPTPVAVPQSAPSHPPMVKTWMAAPGADPIEAFLPTSASLVAILASRAPRFALGLEPNLAIDQARHFPALCEMIESVPAAEPVCAFVQASSHAVAIHTVPALRVAAKLAFAAEIDRAAHAPSMSTTWEASPAPEPVAAFVRASQSTELVAAPHTLQLPYFTAEFEPTSELDTVVTPDPCGAWMPSPAAEPVAAFLQTSTALVPQAVALRLPTLSPAMHEGLPLSALAAPLAVLEPAALGSDAIAALAPNFAPADLRYSALAPATLPSSRPAPSVKWIKRGADSELGAGRRSVAGSLPADTAEPVLPAPHFTADLEPLPALDDLLDPPAMCEAFLPAPAAEPVFSYLQASVAGSIEISCQVTLPAALDYLALTHVPRIRQSQAAPFAEAVMAKVMPAAATAPLVLLRKANVVMPAAPGQAAGEVFENSLGATDSARPEAVEALLGASHSAIPISILRAPRAAALTAPGLVAPSPISGDVVPGAEPAPLEAPLVATVAAELPMARSVRVLPLVMSAALEQSVPTFPALQMAPEISQPAPALPRQEEPHPVSTLSVVEPGPSPAALESHLPQHDIAPLEFHTARLRGEPVGRPEWIPTRIALQPPSFALQAALDKLEDPAAQPKPAKHAPEILNMPAAKRQPTVLMVAGRVAAAFLLASALWYGVTNFRSDRRVNSEDLASSGPAIAPNEPASATAADAQGKPAPAAPKGAFASLKQAIADRASLKVVENFKSMDSWEGVEKTRPAGWKRHADGYMNTGEMALFSPTLKFKDYRMEFFGQIEQKGIGWTVRSKDAQNYHAMKLSVTEAGTRPFVALVQYNVVDGKAGRKTQTPLNIMVHNNRPLQFAVDVKGNRFVTSIDGEEVDSYVDSTLVAGGVGFFSDTGERARLYWLRVARNDDWLGHVCAMLADTVSTTATLRTPAGPAGPLPGLPDSEDSLLLGAAWLGLPYLRASRKNQLIKSWRTEPWNS